MKSVVLVLLCLSAACVLAEYAFDFFSADIWLRYRGLGLVEILLALSCVWVGFDCARRGGPTFSDWFRFRSSPLVARWVPWVMWGAVSYGLVGVLLLARMRHEERNPRASVTWPVATPLGAESDLHPVVADPPARPRALRHERRLIRTTAWLVVLCVLLHQAARMQREYDAWESRRGDRPGGPAA